MDPGGLGSDDVVRARAEHAEPSESEAGPLILLCTRACIAVRKAARAWVSLSSILGKEVVVVVVVNVDMV